MPKYKLSLFSYNKLAAYTCACHDEIQKEEEKIQFPWFEATSEYFYSPPLIF